MNDFYVYAHFDNMGARRYIGKGSGYRAWNFCQRSNRWREAFANAKPRVEILHSGLSESDACEFEKLEIADAISRNEPIVNVAAGGVFSDQWDERACSMLSEQRAGEKHWSHGKERPEETRRKIRETKRANPEKSIARAWLGKKRDPEFMKRFIASAHTPEAHAKAAATKRGKPWTEARRNADEARPKKRVRCTTTGDEFESINAAARAFGLNSGRVSEIVNGKRAQAKGFHFTFC